MATVRKCDICGKVYDMYPTGTETNMTISTMTRADAHSHVYGSKEMDCCSECTEKVLSFVDVLKTYPTRYCINILDEEV